MSLRDGWLLAALLALTGAAPADPAPDPRWQQPIAQAAAAVVRQDGEAAARVEALRDQGRTQRDELLVQLALFLERSPGTEQSMAGALLLSELAFTSREKLDAILPHLGRAGPGLRRVFTEMLSTIDRRDGGDPDFSFYEEMLRARRQSPPDALVLYMYEVSADAALDSMERVHGPGASRPAQAAPQAPVTKLRAFLSRPAGAVPASASQAGEDLLQARAALGEIARDPAWWRRLYAAAMARAHPDLSTPELASRLAGDPHSLVRQAAGGK